MSVIISKRPVCTLNQQEITAESNLPLGLELNPSAEKIAAHCALPAAMGRFLSTAEGAHLVVKGMSDSLKLARELGCSSASMAAQTTSEAADIIALPSLYVFWQKAKNSIHDFCRIGSHLTSVQMERLRDKAVCRNAEAIGLTGKALATALKLSSQDASLLGPIQPMLQGVSLVGGIANLKVSCENFNAANQAIAQSQGISNECKEVLHQTKTLNLLTLAGHICALAAVLLGIGLMVMGGGKMVGAALLIAGLSRTLFAISSKIYEHEMRSKFDFYDEKCVKPLSLQA
jgi:hypothetical protein